MDFSLLLKSYDLRGIYPTQIDESYFLELGKAFGLWAPMGTIIIGGDARLSTPSMKSSFIEGLLSVGQNVADIGIVSSDMLQFSSIYYADATASVMITASHNPKQYNGMKCCLKNAEPINLKQAAPELIHIIETGKTAESYTRGTFETRDILAGWIDKIASFTMSDFSGLKVVADAGNGTAGVFMGALAEKLGFELVPLFFEPDGNFPNHHPSPIESKNMVDLIAKVREVGADIGVAFDGDADRAVMCDENGEIISASIALCAIAEMLLARKPGGKIIHNATCSNIVADTVRANGGEVIREKVGHVYIKERMKNDPDVIFAGEHSSHYFFRELGNADSGVAAFVCVLEYLAQYELSAAGLQAKFAKYHNIEETNYEVADPKAVIEKLAEEFNDGTQDRFDGLTVRYSDWWFNVRPSSNEPLLRLNLEANNAALLAEKLELLSTNLAQYRI